MEDLDIIRQIDDLVGEEHRLELSHQGTPLGEPELQRLGSIQVALDQCWDLLRQRRARRAAWLDPDGAQVRPESVTEHYWQ